MQYLFNLNARDELPFKVRTAIMLAWSLASAVADLFGHSTFVTNKLLPTFAQASLALRGEVANTDDLFNRIENLLDRISRASALLDSAEDLLLSSLADRLIAPKARLPIPVVHDPRITDLLSYDINKDVVLCRCGDWSEIVSEGVKLLKVLASIHAAGLTAQLVVGDTTFAFPRVSPSLFHHGHGAGTSVVSAGSVTGMYQVAGEIEVRIHGFRENRVLRAQLSPAARLAAVAYRPKFTAALQFSQRTARLPLMPCNPGKVLIERMWDIEEQMDLQFTT